MKASRKHPGTQEDQKAHSQEEPRRDPGGAPRRHPRGTLRHTNERRDTQEAGRGAEGSER
jgi:hypothetical protein